MSQFNQMAIDLPDHNVFSLGNRLTTTLDFGRLQVAKVFECVPSDIVNINLHAFVEGAPNPAPINGRMEMSAFAFFVPTRIVFEEWNNYILGLSDPVLPYSSYAEIRAGLQNVRIQYGRPAFEAAKAVLADMGYPSALFDEAPITEMNSFKFNGNVLRLLNRVWWDWFRDKQNISDAMESAYCRRNGGRIDSAELRLLLTPKYRCFPKDYLTMLFPSPSEGGVRSCVPILSENNPQSQNKAFTSYSASDPNLSNYPYDYTAIGVQAGTSASGSGSIYPTMASVQTQGGAPGSLQTHFNIQQLRDANAYQRWLEHLLVCGKSVITRLKGLFGASDTPERLQMSEYLGGTTAPFNFNQQSSFATTGTGEEVSQPTAFGFTSSYAAASATMAGQKTGNCNATLELGNISYHAKEHGYIIIVTSIMPIVQNYLGIERTLTRGVSTIGSDRFDFFTHEMENLGFQPVLMNEALVPTYNSRTEDPLNYDPLKVIGYQQKYMDYKFSHDAIGGQFISNNSTRNSLKNMHLGRDLMQEFGYTDSTGAQIYNDVSFTASITPANLALCDESSRQMFDQKFTVFNSELDHFIVNYKIDITASRPMVQNAIPALSEAEAQGGHGKQMIPTGGIRL